MVYVLGMKNRTISNEWDLLVQFFPDGWEEQAKRLGALKRQRKFKSASELLRLLLIHLADGCSMREATTRAKQAGMISVTDVALLKRLRVSSDWFRWMSVELLKRRGVEIGPPDWLTEYNVKSVDGSTISEPGSTGTDWRLHYSLQLFNLRCDDFLLTQPNVGESFTNFKIHPGDLLIGDRAYGRLNGIRYVLNQGGHFLARLKNKAFKIYSPQGKEVNLLQELEGLAIGEVKDIEITGRLVDGSMLPLRLCALKKSTEEAEKAVKSVLRIHNKKQRRVDPETLNLHRYIIFISSLPSTITALQVAEIYRIRWQIEIAFKRLKSIMGLGHLPKIDVDSARAWLHGKLFVALLVQAIMDEGRFFSPWGYPLPQ
ncbi:MAG: IS4 family transposase [Desulfobacteraceae bacterium]|nr:IS4 family transposase [Desulfobacteraceae bacterium]